MLNNYAFIFYAEGADPERDRAVIETKGLTTTVVAAPSLEAAPQIAAGLAKEGAQLIELCGAFGPETIAKVMAAVKGKAPVGAVSYGPDAVGALARLFPEE